MAAPANDNIANAQVLTSGTQVTGSTLEATVEPGELRGTSSTPGPSVWFVWVCPTPAPGPVQLDTIGSNFDTFLGVYTRTVRTPTTFADLSHVVSDDDGGGSSTSRVNFTPRAGMEYWIQVCGYDSSRKGSYVFRYPTPGPLVPTTNDNLANAVTLQPGTTTYGLVDNIDATTEPGELTGNNSTTATIPADGLQTLWWRWLAPSTGSATISTTGSFGVHSTNWDSYLTIFKAKPGVPDPVTSVADLDIVGSDDESGGNNTSAVTFAATAGVTYYAQVRSFSAASPGFVRLNYPSPGSPPWLNRTSGVAARNGSTQHVIPFGFTSASGNELVVVVYGAVTHTDPSGTWNERLSPVSSGELSVFTKTSTGDSTITIDHNGSNRPVAWAAFEFPAGTTWTTGAGGNASTASPGYTALTGLPGTPQLVIAARGRVAGSTAATAGSSAWTAPMVEDADLFTAHDGSTEGAYLTVAHATAVTGTSIAPAATSTYGGTWVIDDRQHAVFALTLGTGGSGPVTHTASGTAAATSTATATASVVRGTSGTAARTSTASGTASVSRSVSGTAAGTSSASGAASIAGSELAGTTSASSTTSGTLTATAVVAATVAGASTAYGTATATRAVAGTAAGSSAATGSQTVNRAAASGTAGGTTGASAAGLVTAITAGTAAGTATAISAGQVTRVATGSAAGTSTATAAVTLTGSGSYGDAAGTSTASGTTTVARAAAGTAAGVSGSTGVATRVIPATGSAAGAGAAIGSATIAGSDGTGTADAAGGSSGNATVTVVAAGTATGASTSSAFGTVYRDVNGFTGGLSTATGSATTVSGGTSVTAGVSNASGAASIVRVITGSAAGLAAASSVGAVGTSLVGVANGVSLASAASGNARRPGILTAGTTRSRLVAGTTRGPTYS